MNEPEKLVDYTEFHAEQDLRYLSLALRVVAAYVVLLSCVPLVAGGLSLLTRWEPALRAAVSASGLVLGLLGLGLAVCSWLAGGYLKRRVNYRFCRTISILLCAAIPAGTFYGAVTYLTLGRRLVREQFAGPQLPEASSSSDR